MNACEGGKGITHPVSLCEASMLVAFIHCGARESEPWKAGFNAYSEAPKT